jgi:hypothetical protein
LGAPPLNDRRHSSRPRNGDTKACPKCGSLACCEFNDRYRFENLGIAPAWICGCPPCHYRELVRRQHRRLFERGLIRPPHDAAPQAKRRMMKARNLAPRSPKPIVKSANGQRKVH